MTDAPEYLTYEDAAKRAGKSIHTIRSWVRAGYLERYKKPLDKHMYVRVDELDRVSEQAPEPIRPADDDGGGA